MQKIRNSQTLLSQVIRGTKNSIVFNLGDIDWQINYSFVWNCFHRFVKLFQFFSISIHLYLLFLQKKELVCSLQIVSKIFANFVTPTKKLINSLYQTGTSQHYLKIWLFDDRSNRYWIKVQLIGKIWSNYYSIIFFKRTETDGWQTHIAWL